MRAQNTIRTCCVHKLIWMSKQKNNLCTQHLTVDSLNNLLSYCGLVGAKIRASDIDLPVIILITESQHPYKTCLSTFFIKKLKIVFYDKIISYFLCILILNQKPLWPDQKKKKIEVFKGFQEAWWSLFKKGLSRSFKKFLGVSRGFKRVSRGFMRVFWLTC